MKPTGTVVLAIALCATAGLAAAQTAGQPMQQPMPQSMPQQGQGQTRTEGSLNLSAMKGNSITQALSLVVPQQVPSFQGQLGSRAPDEANARPLPADVAAQVPEARNFLYAKLPDRIVLIDPDTRTVAEIIMDMSAAGASTTGSSSDPSPSGRGPSSR